MSRKALEKIVAGIKGDVEACQKGDGPVNTNLGSFLLRFRLFIAYASCFFHFLWFSPQNQVV